MVSVQAQRCNKQAARRLDVLTERVDDEDDGNGTQIKIQHVEERVGVAEICANRVQYRYD